MINYYSQKYARQSDKCDICPFDIGVLQEDDEGGGIKYGGELNVSYINETVT